MKNNIAQEFLKISGIDDIEKFYAKYPTEESFFQAFPRQAKKMRAGGSLNQTLNQDQITMGSHKEPSKGMEALGTTLDILTGNVIQGFTGKSISGMMGVNKGKGSMFSQIEDTTHEAAAGIVGGVFPMAKPFIEGREGMRTAIAPAIGGTTVGGTDLVGEAGANAIRAGSKTIGGFAGGMMGGGGTDMMSFAAGGPMGMSSQNNQLEEIDGYPHEMGGTMIADGVEAEKGEAKINIKGHGDFIFSDKVINPMTNKSYAKEAKSIQNEQGNKWRSSWDTATKRYFEKRMQELANKQEKQKAEQQALLMQQQEMEQYANGEQPMMMEFGGGIRGQRNLWAGNQPNVFANNQPNLFNVSAPQLTTNIGDGKQNLNLKVNDSFDNRRNIFADNKRNYFGYTPSWDPDKGYDTKPTYDIKNRKIDGSVSKEDRINYKKSKSKQSSEKEPNYNQNFGPGIAGSMIGPAANFIAAALAPGPRLNPHVNLNTVNAAVPMSIAMRQGNESKAGYMNALKNNAYTAGSLLGNMGAVYPQANAESASAIADLNYRINQGNVETKNRQELVNQGITSQNNLMQDQSMAQRWNLGLKGAENLGQNMMGIGRDMNMMNRDRSMLGMTDQANWKIVLNPKTGRLEKVFISDLEG